MSEDDLIPDTVDMEERATDEDDMFLNDVRSRVKQAISKVAEEYGFDLAYYKFRLTCETYYADFTKRGEVVLIDQDRTYCTFCGQPANHEMSAHMNSADSLYVCAACFGEIMRDSEYLKR